MTKNLKNYYPIFKNIAWLLAEQGTRLVLGLVIVSILARQLGVEQYGMFQYALSLVAIFSSISFICGAEVLVPSLTNATVSQRQEIMGNAFCIRWFFSVIAYVGLLIFAFLTEAKEHFYLIALLGTTLLFIESFGVVTAWLQSQTNSKPRSLLVMLSLLIKVLLMGSLFFLKNQNIFLYASVYVLDYVFVALGLFVVFYKKTGQTFFSYSFPVAYGLFRKGLPFFGGLMVMFLFVRLDLFMIKQFSTAEVLGHYAAAVQLFNQVNAIAPILVMSLAPLLVYRYNQVDLIKKNTLKIVFIMFIIALIGAIFVQIVAPYIIPWLFGVDYQASIPMLCSLVWVACLMFVNEGLNIYLLKMELGRLVSMKWVLALLVSVPAYWFLVPKYEAIGAIMSYALGYLVACLFGIYVLFNTNTSRRLKRRSE